jgi:hypothetical protein
MNMYRQGDVLIIRVSTLPGGLKERASRVVMEGEATGHAHVLEEGRVLVDAEGALFLDVPQRSQVVHEEHRAIVLEPGIYRIVRQREYTPEALREIMD